MYECRYTAGGVFFAPGALPNASAAPDETARPMSRERCFRGCAHIRKGVDREREGGMDRHAREGGNPGKKFRKKQKNKKKSRSLQGFVFFWPEASFRSLALSLAGAKKRCATLRITRVLGLRGGEPQTERVLTSIGSAGSCLCSLKATQLV